MHPGLSTDLVTIRNFLDSDKNFIYATWLNGLRYGNPVYGFIDKDSYYKNYQNVIDTLINNHCVDIRVACLEEEPEVILGYSVYTDNILHWVFVKPVWRKLGIAKQIVPNPCHYATHITTIGRAIIEKHNNAIRFDPFLL